MCRLHRSADRTEVQQALLGTHICGSCTNQARLWYRTSIGDQVWDVFQAAGEPHDLKHISGILAVYMIVVSCRLPGEVWSGQLGGPAAATCIAAQTQKYGDIKSPQC